MKPIIKRVVLVTAVLVIPLLSVTAFAEAVKVQGGLVEGIDDIYEAGITVYRGIPFAAPPVGDLRWKAPQPVKSWEGVLKADNFAPACPQIPYTSGYRMETSEDCLYLNIWTPAKSPADKLPVMVWIHGGGFVTGSASSSLYSGEKLARMGVIVVCIAYRLGVLGFLAHPELSAESEKKVSGNYGLLDQIAGLKWVRNNIKAFGGNPGNVTIFGESAGGISVSMLAASPLAKGLFHRAICQSGGSFAPAAITKEVFFNMQLLKGAESDGVEFLKRMETISIKNLRKISPDKLTSDPATQMGDFWPVIDGYAIADDQYKLYESSKYNDVPVLIGTNSDEGSMFVHRTQQEEHVRITRMRFGPYADQIMRLYPSDEGRTLRAMADIFGDTSFAWPTWAWAKLQSKTGSSKVYIYYFDQEQTLSLFPSPLGIEGAPHGAEVSYVFKHLEMYRMKILTDEDRALSDTMAKYWTNFAKNGDPNGEGLPEWPVFKDNEPTVMYLKGKPAPGPVSNLDKLKVLDEYFKWKRENQQ